MPGTLFVVATPIGNLEDFTFRALRTLKEVDLIAAEDTRRTRGLLTHYGVSKPLVSLREHNERREAPGLVQRLVGGESIALVSDAGTPGISDPGAGFVRLAREAGISVVPIPGPSAVTAGLSASGLTFDSFVFLGFPPASGAARLEWFDKLVEESRTCVLFEAPHRITRTMALLASKCANRPIIVGREITKKFEEFVIYQNNDSPLRELRSDGEFVIIVGESQGVEADDRPERYERAIAILGHIVELEGVSEPLALAAASAASGVPAAKLRKLAKQARFARNRALERP